MFLSAKRLTLAIVVIFLSAIPLMAGVLLKPTGQDSIPLQMRSFTADATIHGQFASTTLNMVFLNESENRMEADFIYTLPDGAVATYFAYWAGDEKVVARIVEKERAREIYRTITTRQRDPALVEMIGKNTFRARVFPIMPDADLKVELKIVQVLPSSQDGMTYTVPIYNESAPTTYDNLNINVRIDPDESIQEVKNNYGLAIKKEATGYSMQLASTNYKPRKDLKLCISRIPNKLQASLYAARCGGGDGFFALALTSDKSISCPKLAIRGVTVFDVQPAKLASVKAHHPLVVCGRYKRCGPATVTLSGSSKAQICSTTVVFGKNPIPDNLASKLWATKQIEYLSSTKSNRKQIVELSSRFTIPSKYTSWLAVPKSEMELYKEEKAQAQIETVAHQLGYMITRKGENDRQTKELRKRFDQLVNQLHYDDEEAKDWISNEVNKEVYKMSRNLGLMVAKDHAGSQSACQTRLRIIDICKKYDWNAHDMLDSGIDLQLEELSPRYVDMIAEDQQNTSRGRALKSQIARLSKMTSYSLKDRLSCHIGYKIDHIAEQIVLIRHDPKPDKELLVSLNTQLSRLSYYTGKPIDPKVFEEHERWWRTEKGDQLHDQIGHEIRKSRPDFGRIQTIRKELFPFNVGYRGQERAQEYDQAAENALQRRHELLDIESDLRNAKKTKDTARAKGLKERKETTTQQLWNYLYDMKEARYGDPLISIDAPADAQQIIAFMPDGEIKTLEYNPSSKRWEARFDIPAYALDGDYAIQIIIVQKDGTRKTLVLHYTVDTTPPHGNASATETAQSVRLQLDADQDTARVIAVLPWGERVALDRSGTANRFFKVVQLPADYQKTALKVEFVLTDKAHNRSTITLDLNQ